MAMGHSNISAALGPESQRTNVYHTPKPPRQIVAQKGGEDRKLEPLLPTAYTCIQEGWDSTTVPRWGEKITKNIQKLPAARGIRLSSVPRES